MLHQAVAALKIAACGAEARLERVQAAISGLEQRLRSKLELLDGRAVPLHPPRANSMQISCNVLATTPSETQRTPWTGKWVPASDILDCLMW